MTTQESFFTNVSILKMSLIQLQMDALSCKESLSSKSSTFKENGGSRKTLITIESKINKILSLPDTVSWGILASSFKSMRKIKSKIKQYNIICK